MAHFTLESPVFQNKRPPAAAIDLFAAQGLSGETAETPESPTGGYGGILLAKRSGVSPKSEVKFRWRNIEYFHGENYKTQAYIYIYSIFGHTKHDKQSLLKSFNQPTSFTTPHQRTCGINH